MILKVEEYSTFEYVVGRWWCFLGGWVGCEQMSAVEQLEEDVGGVAACFETREELSKVGGLIVVVRA